MATDTLTPYDTTEVINPPTLADILIDVLATPMSITEIVSTLNSRDIRIVTSGYLKGYLDSMLDRNQLYIYRFRGGDRKLYSSQPIGDFTHRYCPSCGKSLLILNSNVGGVITCSKCSRKSMVEMTLGSGVQLKTIVEQYPGVLNVE